MISYIKGIVENIENDKVIIDNNGIGYGIFMPGHVLDTIGIGEELKIYTYFKCKGRCHAAVWFSFKRRT